MSAAAEKEYRICGIVDGQEHIISTIGCWGPKHDYLPTSEDRRAVAELKLAEYRKHRSILSSVHDVTKPEDLWIEEREVEPWHRIEDGK